MKALSIAALALVAALGLSACGSSTTVESTATQGQELIDLQAAYDKGVIDKKEYERAKKRILDRRH